MTTPLSHVALDLEPIKARCDGLNEFGLMGSDGFPLSGVYEAVATDIPLLIAEVERQAAEIARLRLTLEQKGERIEGWVEDPKWMLEDREPFAEFSLRQNIHRDKRAILTILSPESET